VISHLGRPRGRRQGSPRGRRGVLHHAGGTAASASATVAKAVAVRALRWLWSRCASVWSCADAAAGHSNAPRLRGLRAAIAELLAGNLLPKPSLGTSFLHLRVGARARWLLGVRLTGADAAAGCGAVVVSHCSPWWCCACALATAAPRPGCSLLCWREPTPVPPTRSPPFGSAVMEVLLRGTVVWILASAAGLGLGLGLGFAFKLAERVATPQVARGWAHPPCRHFKIQSCPSRRPSHQAVTTPSLPAHSAVTGSGFGSAPHTGRRVVSETGGTS
jgi:hypothetical protein